MEQELTRATVDPKYTWDLTKVFADDDAWESAFAKVQEMTKRFAGYEGRLGEGRETVFKAVRDFIEIRINLGTVFCYATMKQNEDGAVARYQAMLSRAESLISDMQAKTAFFMPELLTLPEDELRAMIDAPDFADYDIFLKSLLRQKAHMLTASEERILALANEVTGVPENVFSMMRVNMDFGKTRGEGGEKVILTDVRLLALLQSKDRAVRKAAYSNIMNGYREFGDAISAIYAGQVKADIFESRARGYSSPREDSLYPDEISEDVYDSLIDAVHGGILTLSEYLKIKRDQLGVGQLHMYDLYADPADGFDISMDIEEAFETFLEAVKPLGEDYVRDASVALRERWIDVFETKNKRGGAYSMNPAPWAPPYVLLNYKKNYDGVSTLCHEMGHSMHSYYSSKTQPYSKSRYTIFVAEVASTCNEILLSEYLRKKYEGNRKAQIMLIGSLLKHFRTTVFRQTMFAEFEQKAHQMAMEGKALTMESLSDMYYELNKLYYGKACKVDREVAYEWMRIPHFYSPFYVYKYATGFCSAVALARGILSGDPEKVAAYRKFLTLGGSMPPLEELKIAGVDMSTPQPVCDALDYFAELVLQYRELIEQEKEEN